MAAFSGTKLANKLKVVIGHFWMIVTGGSGSPVFLLSVPEMDVLTLHMEQELKEKVLSW